MEKGDGEVTARETKSIAGKSSARICRQISSHGGASFHTTRADRRKSSTFPF